MSGESITWPKGMARADEGSDDDVGPLYTTSLGNVEELQPVVNVSCRFDDGPQGDGTQGELIPGVDTD